MYGWIISSVTSAELLANQIIFRVGSSLKMQHSNTLCCTPNGIITSEESCNVENE
jgi:hypothetical protein